MKITSTSVIKFIIIVLIIINVSLTKLFGNIFNKLNDPKFLVCCILICLLCTYLKPLKKYNSSKFINQFSLFIFFMIVIETAYTMIIYNYSLIDCWISLERFSFVFLAYPIYYVLINKKWNLNKFVKIIVWFTFISYLVRIGISYIEGKTGNIINSSIALECAPQNWFRNGILRINPPCFGIIFIALTMYLFYESDRKMEKTIYILMIAIAFYYSAIIHGSRSALIYQLICTFMILIMKKRTSKKQLLFWISISIILVIILNTSLFYKITSFIAGFSINSSEYGISTVARLNANTYFYNWFKENIIFGIGALVKDDMLVPYGNGNIADIGFLGNIYRFGVFGIILYIFLFGRYLIITIKYYFTFMNSKKTNNYFILLLGIMISNILFSINIDCFYEIFAFSVPFSIAIVEFLAHKSVN